jgi:hypothetical protein
MIIIIIMGMEIVQFTANIIFVLEVEMCAMCVGSLFHNERHCHDPMSDHTGRHICIPNVIFSQITNIHKIWNQHRGTRGHLFAHSQ